MQSVIWYIWGIGLTNPSNKESQLISFSSFMNPNYTDNVCASLIWVRSLHSFRLTDSVWRNPCLRFKLPNSRCAGGDTRTVEMEISTRPTVNTYSISMWSVVMDLSEEDLTHHAAATCQSVYRPISVFTSWRCPRWHQSVWKIPLLGWASNVSSALPLPVSLKEMRRGKARGREGVKTAGGRRHGHFSNSEA